MENLNAMQELLGNGQDGKEGKGFSTEMLSSLMGGRNPKAMLRTFIKIGSAEMLEPMLKDVDWIKDGGDCLEAAIENGKPELIDMFIKKGADIMLPPDTIQEKPEYRNTPFVISAAMSGDYKTLLKVLHHGGSLADSGSICLSKKRKNQVISNTLGAAAWAGKADMLKQLCPQLPNGIDLMAVEQPDKKLTDKLLKAQGAFQREYYGYTPLMLAVASPSASLECVRILLTEGANAKCKDEFGNNILHIAAMNGNNKIIEYMAKNVKIDIFARNKVGDSALIICQDAKNQEGTKILEQFQSAYDKSDANAKELLNELIKEDDNDEEAKNKRRQKKWRNKVNKIAKTENITVEEVEERLHKEDEKKKEQEAQAKIDEANREKKEQADALKRKAELKKQFEQAQKEAQMEELAERRKIEAEEREIRDERRNAQAEKRERYKSAARETRPAQNKQEYGSMKCYNCQKEGHQSRECPEPKQEKKTVNKESMKCYNCQKEGHQSRECPEPKLESMKCYNCQKEGHQSRECPEPKESTQSLKKERVKSTVRKTEETNDAYSRPNRHQGNNVADTPRTKSKSVRRGNEEIIVENKLTAEGEKPQGVRQVYGLGGEMALASATSKKAQQRIKKKLKEAATYEEENKAMLERLAKDKADAQSIKFEEEKKKQKEEREAQKLKRKEAQDAKKKTEDDAKAVTKDPKVGDTDETDAKKADKKKKQRGAKKDKDGKATPTTDSVVPQEKTKLVYRPKTAPANQNQATQEEVKVEVKPKEEKVTKQTAEKAPVEKKEVKQTEAQKSADVSDKGGKAPKKEKAPKQDKAPKKENAKEPVKVDMSLFEQESKNLDTQQAPQFEEKSEPKPKSAKSEKSVKSASGNTTSNAQIEALQKLLIAKENEIGRLQKHIDKQDSKYDAVNKSNENLKDQIKQSTSGGDLSQKIADLNEKLRKQTALNRLQASQILEFEQALWQATKQVEEAEQKAYDSSAPNAPTDSAEGLLQDANHELRVKSIQMREIQQKLDSYQGKGTAINGMSRIELKDLAEQLNQSLFNIKAKEQKN